MGGEAAHGVRKKEKHQQRKPQCTAGGHIAQSEQAAGERVGAIVHETKNGTAGKQHRVASGRLEKTQRTQAARWGIGTGNGMGNGGGARWKGPQKVQ